MDTLNLLRNSDYQDQSRQCVDLCSAVCIARLLFYSTSITNNSSIHHNLTKAPPTSGFPLKTLNTVLGHTTRSLQLTANRSILSLSWALVNPYQAGPAYRIRLMVVALVTW